MDQARPMVGGSPPVSEGIIFRMIAPVLAVSVLLLTVGAVSAWYVHRLQQEVAELLTQDVSSIRAAEELVITVQQIETSIDQYLLTGAREHLDAILAHRPETERWLGEARRLAATERERSLLSAIKEDHDRFWEGLAEIRRLEDPAIIKVRMRDPIYGILARGILLPAQEYLDSRERDVAIDSEENRAMPNRVALVLLLLGTCGALAGLLSGYGIARGIGRSIAQLSVPIRDAAGKLSEVVGPISLSTPRDVEGLEVELRRVADEIGTVVERLERSQREALRAEQLAGLGQMAAGLAHELRNPLTSMKILVQSASERGDAAGLSGRPLAVLEEEITRLDRSIQAFLDFARPPEIEKRTFDLGRVVGQVLSLVSPTAALKGVRIEGEFPGDPIIIEADMGHVRQVLLNLLLNALDATPEGGTVLIRVATGSDDRPHSGRDRDTSDVGQVGDWIEVRVADTGCGLPAALGDRIFEPFVSTKETGLGLGLSICRRIVESHGGQIRAANRPGGGAEFSVRLPLGEVPGPRGGPPGLDDRSESLGDGPEREHGDLARGR